MYRANGALCHSCYLVFIYTLICLLPLSLDAQCDISDDYEDPEAWTQVGAQVEVSFGSVSFLDGAANGEQRRVYRALGITLEPNDLWTVHVDFNVLFVGTTPEGPATGHNIVALTAGTQQPLNDCPDIPCTGTPASTQDGIMVAYSTPDPPDGEMGFSIIVTNGDNEEMSERIPGNIVDTDYYITLERTAATEAQLSIYSDVERTSHVEGSPVSLTFSSGLGGLTHVQHTNHARGAPERQLTGTVDNLCIEHMLTSTHEIFPYDQYAYPNPTTAQLFFQNGSPKSVRLIHSDGVISGEWMNPASIDVRHLPAGIYFLRVDVGHQVNVQRIIKH